MAINPDKQRADYRAKCTHYRNKAIVCSIDGNVVFDGRDKKQNVGIGMNKAKRFVRDNNLRSFTVK